MNEVLMEEALAEGVDTIVTCDNGIAAAAQIDYGKRLGMTVVVTDHHEIPYEEMEDGERKYLLPDTVAKAATSSSSSESSSLSLSETTSPNSCKS